MGGFHLDRNGTGWMGGNGIARWDPVSGSFTGFWNWQNNPGMGVTLFVDFAEDAAGRLFAADDYGNVFRFDGSQWIPEPVALSLPLGGLPGMIADSRGTVWVADRFDVFHRTAGAWQQVTQPTPTWFFDLGGINVMAIGPGDVKWFGTDKGLVRWDGTSFDLFDTGNSPLPAPQVVGIDVRADGLLAVTAIDFGTVTPFPNGVALVDGDPAAAASWSVHSYASSPLQHYQLGRTRFDGDGNLWVSTISEGVAVLLHPAQRLGCDRLSIPASTGGTVDFRLRGGPMAAGQGYVLLASLSGRTPGVVLPGGTLPLEPDALTHLSPTLPGFVGVLDGTGSATVPLTLPPFPGAVGLSADLAWVQPGSWAISNAVAFELLP